MLVNIIGLATGWQFAMIIGPWRYDEVMMHQTCDEGRGTQQALPYSLGDELKSKYPDFKTVSWRSDSVPGSHI